MSQMVKLNDKVSEEIRTAYIQDKLLQRTNNIKPFLHIHTLLFGEILSQQYHGHDQFTDRHKHIHKEKHTDARCTQVHTQNPHPLKGDYLSIKIVPKGCLFK